MWIEYMLLCLFTFAFTVVFIVAIVKHQADIIKNELDEYKIRTRTKVMDVENKSAYFGYIKELQEQRVAHPMNCHNELKKRFPNLDDKTVDRLVNLYIKEEIEGKQTFLTE